MYGNTGLMIWSYLNNKKRRPDRFFLCLVVFQFVEMGKNKYLEKDPLHITTQQ